MTLSDLTLLNDVYERQVQEELQEALSNEGTRAEALGVAIEIHAERREMMLGLQSRIKLEPASRSEWKDPRAADGVPIFARQAPGSTKVNHKLHTTFDRTIIGSKASYFVGIPPEISLPDNERGAEELSGHLRRIGFDFKVNELAQRATGRGTSFILMSTPPGDDDVYIILPYEWSCIVIYDSITGAPVYGIRYWYDTPEGNDTDLMYVEFYDDVNKYTYKGPMKALVMVEEPVAHMLGAMPLIEFPNNTERIGDVELTMSLQDAFDVADSDLSSEISQLRLSYLVLAGNIGSDIDDEWLEQLTRTGVFTMEEGTASFLEKGLNSTAVENLKADLESRIYRYSNSYNPDDLGSDGTMTAYQIRRKLFRLESSTMESEALFRAGLNQVAIILSDFYNLGVDPSTMGITFTRNTPRNIVQDIRDMVEAGYNISQKRMNALSPLDVDQEINEQELQEENGFMPTDGDDLGGAPTGNTEQAVEVAKLSGIQISSANEIITQVTDGVLSREAGIAQLETFLGLSTEAANRVMGPAKTITRRVTVKAVPAVQETPEG